MKSICHGAVRFRQLKKTWLRRYSQGVVEPVGLADVRRRISSLRKRPFLLSLRRWGRFARRNAKHETSPAAKREEKRMFSQAIVSHKVVKQKAWSGEKNNCQFAADVSAMSSFMIVTYVIA